MSWPHGQPRTNEDSILFSWLVSKWLVRVSYPVRQKCQVIVNHDAQGSMRITEDLSKRVVCVQQIRLEFDSASSRTL